MHDRWLEALQIPDNGIRRRSSSKARFYNIKTYNNSKLIISRQFLPGHSFAGVLVHLLYCVLGLRSSWLSHQMTTPIEVTHTGGVHFADVPGPPCKCSDFVPTATDKRLPNCHGVRVLRLGLQLFKYWQSSCLVCAPESPCRLPIVGSYIFPLILCSLVTFGFLIIVYYQE